MQRYDVVGFGNALVDIHVRVDDSFLKRNELSKGSMLLVSHEEQQALLDHFEPDELSLSSGGSTANTLSTLSKLGHKTALVGSIGDDSFGDQYSKKLRDLKVHLVATRKPENTGSSLVAITPDAERTMLTSLGCAPKLNPEHLDDSMIAASKMVYIEGYLWDHPETIQTILKVIEIANHHKVPVAFSASDVFCIERHHKDFRLLLEGMVDVFFCNAEEAKALAKTQNPKKAMEALGSVGPLVFITDGANGSHVYQDKTFAFHVPAVRTQTIDTTGAGDAYAAGIVSGLMNGYSLSKMSELASKIASEVVGKMGASWEGKQSKT